MSDNWIYIHKENMHSRYVLGELGKNPLICIGINPSTAKPDDLDRTLSKIQKYSQQSNKYDGWIMLNVYPLRKTNPDKLPKNVNKSIHSQNIQKIKEIINEYPDSDILCAWGTIIEKRKYLKTCLIDILKEVKSENLKRLTLTKKGHPRHPLYCKMPLELEPFDIDSYKYIKTNHS